MNNIILELIAIGNQIKVNAIDENTTIEVSFIVPKNTLRQDIENLAKRKLDFVINKKK